MKRYKEATYVILVFSLQSLCFLPIGLTRVLHFTTDVKMACFCVGGKREYLRTAAWSQRCHGQGHRMKQKGDKQQGIHKWVRLNAPVDATSEKLLFFFFDVLALFLLIGLPGRNRLSQCVRPRFQRRDITVTAPNARLSPPLPQDSCVHHLSHVPGVQAQ